MMKKLRKLLGNNFLLLIYLLLIISCREKTNPILNKVYNLEHQLLKKDLQKFAEKPENIAISEAQFKLGLKIKSQIVRGKNKDVSILKYFNSRGDL